MLLLAVTEFQSLNSAKTLDGFHGDQFTLKGFTPCVKRNTVLGMATHKSLVRPQRTAESQSKSASVALSSLRRETCSCPYII